jgi:magnesium transporter
MIKTIAYNGHSKQFTENFPTAKISEYCADKTNTVWADISDPTSHDFSQLAEEFGFHPMSIEDCRGGHQRPKIEAYPGYYFMVIYEAQLSGPEDSLELRELNLFLGPNYLVTVHSRPLRSVEATKLLWPRWIGRAGMPGSSLLVYLLVDAIVDDYMPLLDILNERTDELVDELFSELKPEHLQQLFIIKRQLVYLRKTVAPLRDVFNVILRREQPFITRESHAYFQDIYDNILRIGDMIDTMRETLGSAMEAYLSISGNRMNIVMKRLTSISTILMSITLIAGIYGMNFEKMPELQWEYGYVFSLLSMVVVALAIYAYLKRIKWL